MSDFDPYKKWLGISSGVRPPDHYQLLGVARFESDSQAIEEATQQRVALLQNLATGKHIEASQDLLNEVAAARRCLLDPHCRAQYDSELMKGRRSASAVTEDSLPEKSDDFPPLIRTSPRQGTEHATKAGQRTQKSKRLTNTQLSYRVLWVVTGLTVAALLWFAFANLSSPNLPATLRVRWPLDQRVGAEFKIDGREISLPNSAELEIPLSLGKHYLVFLRSGYEDIEQEVVFGTEPVRIQLDWLPLISSSPR